MSNQLPLFFDIETGDLQAERSPVLSISYARGQEVRSMYAAPPKGSFISKWVSENVWEPIKQRLGKEPTESEESILRDFLGVLEGHRGGTIAGWNIGYVPTPQAPGVKGLDIPFLMTRAEKYGLGDQYQKAFEGVNVRDIGREYSVRVASEISKYPGLVDEKLFAQAQTFNQLVDINSGIRRLNTIPEKARWMGTPGQYGGYEVAGWKLKNVYSYLFGENLEGHHLSEADVLATQRIHMEGDPSKRMVGPEFAALWNTTALANKAEASARAGLEEEGNFVGRAAARGATGILGAGLSWAVEHKKGLGIAAAGIGAVGLYNLFSGKDDSYNTIEGLKHGGLAEQLRKKMTDFGSGWLRRAISSGASEANISKALKIATGYEAKFAVMGGEKWLAMKELGRGGFGTAELALGMQSGRVGVLKTALREEPIRAGMVARGPLINRPEKAMLAQLKKDSSPQVEKYFDRIARGYMGDVFKAGRQIGAAPGTIGYEVAMQKLARKELGDIVPEVYAQGEKSFIQEYAGSSIASLAQQNRLTPETAKGALDFMQSTFGSMYEKRVGMAHFDPSFGNITKRGNRYMIIDWGLAAPVGAESIARRKYMGYSLLPGLRQSYERDMNQVGDKIATAIVNHPGNPVAPAAAGGTMIVGNAEKKRYQSQLQHLASKQMSENTARAGKGHRSYTTTNRGRR